MKRKNNQALITALQQIADTVATHGNRGVLNFIEAARIANCAVAYANRCVICDCEPSEIHRELVRRFKEAQDEIRCGLKTYLPGHEYFNANTALTYAFLMTL